MKKKVLIDFLNNRYDIEGWLYPGDIISMYVLGIIQSQVFKINGLICEIGVFKGKSFSFLSHFIQKNEKLLGYDIFPGDFYECAEHSLEKYGAKVLTELIKVDTSELSSKEIKDKMDGKKIRILHIDAGHEYHEVLHSLISFAPHVSDKGIIILDDYQDNEFPGVEAAVLDFCSLEDSRHFVPFFMGQNKIYLSIKPMAVKYQNCMLASSVFNDLNKSRLTIVRDFSILIGFSRAPMPIEDLKIEINKFDCNETKSNIRTLEDLAKKALEFNQISIRNLTNETGYNIY